MSRGSQEAKKRRHFALAGMGVTSSAHVRILRRGLDATQDQTVAAASGRPRKEQSCDEPIYKAFALFAGGIHDAGQRAHALNSTHHVATIYFAEGKLGQAEGFFAKLWRRDSVS
jgi:hypothetical protein